MKVRAMAIYITPSGIQGEPLYLRMKIATGLGFTAIANNDGLVEIVAEVTTATVQLGQSSIQVINLILPMTLQVDAITLRKTLNPWFLGNRGTQAENSQYVVTQINSDFIVGYETADEDTVTLYLAQR